MDEFQKHVLHRLDNLEGELRELRDVTWPVCQAKLDGQNSMNNIFQKKTLLRWLDVDEIRKLLWSKGRLMGLNRDQVASELREILVVEPLADAV
jgi:hypothetical protein